MTKFLLKEILPENIENELHYIGFDDGYRLVASDKYKYKNIIIYELSPAQANIIKQTALSLGADCATHREVITGKIEKSNAILTGSISQLKKISEKLNNQPFSLKQLGGELVEFLKPQKRTTKLVGILNITPDSFSDGGKYIQPEDAIKHLNSLIEDGADMIDIGAESTRPYSTPVTPDEQIKRLEPVLKYIQAHNIKIPVSIDTRSSEVADFALNYGANIINDVSGFEYDKKLPEVISKYNAGVVIQHSQGRPENMQDSPSYNNIIEEIYMTLKDKIDYAKNLGITEIIADPGIGFGKTKEDNIQILNRIEEFYGLNCPIMIGVSRKRFLDVEDNDNGLKDALSAGISYPLMKKGVDYLRVHNIKIHKHMQKLV